MSVAETLSYLAETTGMNRHPDHLIRRDALTKLSAGALGLGMPVVNPWGQQNIHAETTKPKSVAIVMTRWSNRLHADVITSKILNGWNADGGPGPNLKIASMYVDQVEKNDLSRAMGKKHGIPIFDSIAGAVTVGTSGIPVDGVISIGEHGSYPRNEKDQQLYPRRRFFSEIAATFEKYGRVVPVFNDKHLGPVWEDALWMYQRAQQLKIPFMAGSSLPLTFRQPEISLPMGSQIEAAVGVGYSGLDIYGIHTLELFQTLVERRQGAETGVKSVQWFDANDMWKVVDSGVVSEDLLAAALALGPKARSVAAARETKVKHTGLFLFQYNDGLTGAIFMMPKFTRLCRVAVKLKGQAQPLATLTEERPLPLIPHFSYLLKALEKMFHTGKPSYPVERTLLTTGILDRVLTSRFEGGKQLLTPELAIHYTPVDYPHAPQPPLTEPFTG